MAEVKIKDTKKKGRIKDFTNKTMGSIAALQTVLERYPVLMTTDWETGKNSFTFMLNLLKILGVTGDEILEWLSGILVENSNTAGGVLFAIEQAVKVAILGSFKNAYTCTINPRLPNSMMRSVYPEIRGDGIEVKIKDIDMFGILSHCPTNEKGKAFYFDNVKYKCADKEIGYTPLNIYQSTDFNAYLWYVINKGSLNNERIAHNSVWDNRYLYYKTFPKKEETVREDFFASGATAPIIFKKIGPKKEILICEYLEDRGEDILKVYANADRYMGDSTSGEIGSNKTIFEFNADYLASIKIFEPKTLIVNIINAVLGLTASMQAEFSIERSVLSKMVREMTTRIIESENTDTNIVDDCYYSFSNDKYNELLNKAILERKGIVSLGDGTETAEYSYDDILTRVNESELVGSSEEQATTIREIFIETAETITKSKGNSDEKRWEMHWDIITKFINETVVEMAMQVFSPKIMLLYAINAQILNPQEGNNPIDSLKDFFNNFSNLMENMIAEIANIIMQELYDYLMSVLRPIISLFVQKILIETLYYYQILLEQLVSTCLVGMGRGNSGNMEIDNVVGADIVKMQTSPKSNSGCRDDN